MFKVVLLNDDYTTMEFVVLVLQQVFNKPEPEAFRIMMQVHIQGRGICGAYTYEIAETKVETVHEMAHENGFPCAPPSRKADPLRMKRGCLIAIAVVLAAVGAVVAAFGPGASAVHAPCTRPSPG